MTTSTIPTLQTDSRFGQEQQNYLPHFTLKWRQAKLLVRLSHQVKQPHLSFLEREEWLADCLKHSPVQLVRIDLDLGQTGLRLWADACQQANKRVFLRVPPTHYVLPRRRSPFRWQLKRLIDWIATALLLLPLSPVMLGLILLMRVSSPGPILFRQWCVGERGKLFQVLKFRTTVVGTEKPHHQAITKQKGLYKHEDNPQVTPLGCWMCKYSLDKLPQLLNVLRGEMSLVGLRPKTLCDLARLNSEELQQLNALPGVIGAWQMQVNSSLLDLNLVNDLDLEYLRNWSLNWDLRILLMIVPKILLSLLVPARADSR